MNFLKSIKRFGTILVLVTVLCVGTQAIEKVNPYQDGMFSDVAADQWYQDEVKNAYEYGIMNGTSTNTFEPDGRLTVAEGVTVAARLHAALNGKNIPASDGEWYTPYMNYAKENGFLFDGAEEIPESPILRFQMAQMLSDACGALPEINTVNAIPDVYSEKILKLFRAGVLAGNDEYGTFDGYAFLKRSELCAMAVRVALPDKRVKKTFVPMHGSEFGDAYGIIENMRGYGLNGLANGWEYDNRFDFFNTTGKASMTLNDDKSYAYERLMRSFRPEAEGKLRLEFNGSVRAEDGGVSLALENEQGKDVLSLAVKNGVWVFAGTTEQATAVTVSDVRAETYNIEMDIDLDKATADVVINNIYGGRVSFEKSTVCRFVVRTGKEEKGYVNVFHTILSKNYAVHDRFLTGESAVGKTPFGWEIDGNFRIAKMQSCIEPDLYSVKSETKAGLVSQAVRMFAPLTGKFSAECMFLLPEKTDGATVTLLWNGTDVLALETKNGGLYLGDTLVNDYLPDIWQTLTVDADTAHKTATVRINGKDKGKFPYAADGIDGIKIRFSPDKDADMWFDDVKVYSLHDYADYPSEPVAAVSDEYNVGVNVCWLWRDQHSGEGWDAVSAFPEFENYLGYYDEGIRETADWEIKLMAEHGIDFMHVCWYAPYANTTAPIKQMRHSHAALHDGYMNAKYSDLVKFCIMWENSFTDVKDLDSFKKYIWNYWVEYYFKDSRYERLDNKALLTVWSVSNFVNSFGGEDGAAEAIRFMNEDIKKYGYDGILVMTNAGGSMNEIGKYTWYSKIGLSGSYIYATSEVNAEKQLEINKKDREYASSYLMTHLPTIGMGFNDVGRNNKRSPIMTESEHLKMCQGVKEMLDSSHTGTFADNTLMISTWNEWSEGHYIMPSESNGFAYLENIRKTFTPDTSDHTKTDAPLSKTQLSRISHTYPPHHTPIRALLAEQPEEEQTPCVKIKVNGTVLSFRYAPKKTADGDYEVVGELRDYGFYSMLRLFADFDRFDGKLDLLTYKEREILFTVGSDKVSADGQEQEAGFVFTLRDGLPVFHIKKFCDLLDYSYEEKDGVLAVKAATDSEYAALDARKDYQYEFSLEEETEGWRGQGLSSLTVHDGKLTGVSIGNDPAVIKNVSFYSGDYSHVRIGVVYEKGLYDNFTPQLFYTTKTSGSYSADKCINGVYVIPENVKDGDIIEAVFEFPADSDLDIITLRFDMFGAPKTFSIDYIRLLNEREKEPEIVYIENSENSWTFDKDGDCEGWTSPLTMTVENGYLSASPANPDPYLLHKVNFKYNDYHVMIVGLKNTGALRGKTGYLYFTTDKSGTLSADKMISAKYRVPSGTAVGDTVEIIFDLSSNPKFKDTITTVRFDPYNDLPSFSIDYIRFCRIEGKESFVHEDTDEDAALTEEETPTLEDRDPIVFKSSYDVPENAPKWDFTDGTEDWKSGLELRAADGVLSAPKNSNADPYVIHNVNFDADAYDMLVVGVKFSELLRKTTGYLYFATDTEKSISADKMISATYRCPKNAQPGDTVEIVFYLHEHAKFTGTITMLRFDPFNDYPAFEVDYIYLANGKTDTSGETDQTHTVHRGSYTEIYDSNHNEFNTDGYDEGWKSSRAITVENGYLKIAGGTVDPYIIKGVSFAADKYDVIVCGVKYAEHLKNKTGYLYFTTSESSSLGEDKVISAKYIISENAKEGDTVEIVFQLAYHPKFTGTIKQIRFDPFNDLPESEIDYIRCCTDYNAAL